MPRPLSRLPLMVGVVLIAAGWAVLYLAWWRAANVELETGQIPYLISGGFGGLALVGLGAAAVVVDVVLRGQNASRQAMDGVREAVECATEAAEGAADAAEGVREAMRGVAEAFDGLQARLVDRTADDAAGSPPRRGKTSRRRAG